MGNTIQLGNVAVVDASEALVLRDADGDPALKWGATSRELNDEDGRAAAIFLVEQRQLVAANGDVAFDFTDAANSPKVDLNGVSITWNRTYRNNTFYVDSSAGTLNLPDAADHEGWSFVAVNSDGTADLTIDTLTATNLLDLVSGDSWDTVDINGLGRVSGWSNGDVWVIEYYGAVTFS